MLCFRFLDTLGKENLQGEEGKIDRGESVMFLWEVRGVKGSNLKKKKGPGI